MEDWKERYDKFEKRFWLKMKGRVYYDNYEVVTIKEGWNIEVKRFIQQEIDKVREAVEEKFIEKCKKREEEMNVPYSEEDGQEFWQGYQEGYHQGLHDMIIDTYYLDKEFQSKLTTK